MNIHINECFSFFSYWGNLRSVSITDIYSEYTNPYENEVLVVVANNERVIAVGIAEDVGETYEMAGEVKFFDLSKINPLELQYLYNEYFEGGYESNQLVRYILSTTPSNRYEEYRI